ncbi:MAG: RNA polymerase sigma factor [Isosphaeraceae bacterium]
MGHKSTGPKLIRAPGCREIQAQSPDCQSEEFLDAIKSYLECRSHGVDPPEHLVETWNQFYHYYAPRMGRYLRGWNLPDADRNDCLQDTWKEVVSSLPHFQHDPARGQLGTWLMTLARNKAVDSIRRRNRHISEHLDEHETGAPLDPSPDPAAEYERRRTMDQVHRILVELSGQVSQTSFQVLYLRWIEDRPTAEVAAALALTPEQVRFRAHRMKRKFRDILERSMERDVLDDNPGRREIDV